MKRLIIAALAIAVSYSVMAVDPYFQINIKAGNVSDVDNIVMTEGSSYTDKFDNAGDAQKFATGSDTLLYSWVESIMCAVVARPNLIGTLVTFQANAATNYVLSFSDVEGKVFALRDNVTGTITTISNTETYAFTANARQKYVDRFEIVEKLVPTAFKVCHQNGMIIVDNNTDEAMDVLVDDSKIGSAPAKTFAAEVPLTGISAGQHYLKVNGQLMIILVQ